ncbi:MAG: ABC transporter ATP-binding protein [Acidimicrobiales bacterium]
MSSEPSVAVRNLSKSYSVATQRETFLLRLALQRMRHPLAGPAETFWALRDVTFDVHPGEVVGIIGRNGAGKSTVLKILSRVTDPTEGEVRLRGRVGCLLEVGTGFHPELTGTENVYLNGAILGMRRNEVRRRFDEIVEFAGVERFLNTPVKRYSSGMYVRLAFAVAAHLDPDILIVDEVLAVGDVEFQKRCLGKMRSVAAEGGRTVLFVSHHMAAVQALCSRVIVLEKGQVAFDGDTGTGMHRYIGLHSDDQGTPGVFLLGNRANPLEDGIPVHLQRLSIQGEQGPQLVFATGDRIRFRLCSTGLDQVKDPYYRIHIRNELDQTVLASDSRMTITAFGQEPAELEIDRLPLLPGQYYVDVGLGSGHRREVLDYVVDAGMFTVGSRDIYGEDYKLIAEDGNIYVKPCWHSV